ncbi:hypothetical protein PTKIN_Ptkin16aG0005800 [Pterospermum kingtungense]
MKLFLVSDDSLNFFMAGVGYVLGDGKKISFWHQEWIPGSVLKFMFPRVYALAVDKNAIVADCGVLINKVWQWNVVLKRRLFGWEENS